MSSYQTAFLTEDAWKKAVVRVIPHMHRGGGQECSRFASKTRALRRQCAAKEEHAMGETNIKKAPVCRLFRLRFSRRAFSGFPCAFATPAIVRFPPGPGPFPEFQRISGATLLLRNSNNFLLTTQKPADLNNANVRAPSFAKPPCRRLPLTPQALRYPRRVFHAKDALSVSERVPWSDDRVSGRPLASVPSCRSRAKPRLRNSSRRRNGETTRTRGETGLTQSLRQAAAREEDD